MTRYPTYIRTTVTRRTALKYAGGTLVGALSAFAGCMGGEDDTMDQAGQPTKTNTPSPSAETTGGDTAKPIETGSTTATGSRDSDLSPLEVYTNEPYSYSIKYPAKWRVNENDPTYVTFTSPAGLGTLGVIVQKGVPQSYTLHQATADFLDGLGPTHKRNPMVIIQSRRNVTLPNGHPAILLDLRVPMRSGSDVRNNVVTTVVNNTVYLASISLANPDYTSTVAQQITDILTSLTIHGGTTSGEAHTEPTS